MYQYLKKAVIFLLPGLFTVPIPLGLLAYQELRAYTASEKIEVVDEVKSLIDILPTLAAEAGELVETESLSEARCDVDEFTWLACGIYFEARNQSVEGQYVVAQVILNRVEDPRWPKTVEAVVRQGEARRNRCQFSFMCDGKAEYIKNVTAWQVATEVATMALEDYYEAGPTTCAHSYHADYVTSEKALKWFANFEVSEKIDDHIFFCD